MTVNPVYDLKDPIDRVRLLLDQPTKAARLTALTVIRWRCGHRVAEELIDELREIDAARKAEGGVA